MIKTKQVLLVGYRDFKKKLSEDAVQSIQESLNEYGDSVKIEFKYYPDIETKPSVFYAAKAVIAAEKQAKSDEIYMALAGIKSEYSESIILKTVQNHGLDMDRFKEDYASEEVETRLRDDIKAAKKSGINVFPGITINGEPYLGAWDGYALKEAIKKRGARRIQLAIESFFSWGASGAMVLIVATIAALIVVNSGYHQLYEHWLELKVGFKFATFEFIQSREVWVNDFFMAIFFLVIGLEIKKEVIDGELSDMKKAAMPVIGAIGGMLVPAMLYVLVNAGTDTINGWGIPMATDIAFTLGLMALLGKRVPIALKVFISALAVADDLGAILVIALFYGHGFHLLPFILSILIVGVMYILNRNKVFNLSLYLVLGVLLWALIFQSGLHATIAGVITAMLIPHRRRANLTTIAEQTNVIFHREINKVKDPNNEQKDISRNSLRILQKAVERLREPSDHLMHSLEKVVNFFILPMFAFFNTGILLTGADVDLLAPLNLGILLGLFIGKPLGIVGACWIASKARIAHLSTDFNWPQLIGASCLAGVGFTMSIVVASSAFNEEVLTSAKISILIASGLSAIVGLLLLRTVTRTP